MPLVHSKPAKNSADPEISQAFKDLHNKLNQTKHDLDLCDAIMDAKKREQESWVELGRTIGSRPGDEVMFEGLGRMFVARSKDDMSKLCEDSVKDAEEKIAFISEQRASVENGYNESKRGLKELIANKHNST